MNTDKLHHLETFKSPSEIDHAVKSGKLSQTQFSMGCFWGPDSTYGSLDGVIQTRVGYAGSINTNPTYKDIKGHAETIRIYYDKELISYKNLVDQFGSWRFTGKKEGQYRPIFYIFDEEQEQTIKEMTKEVGEDQMPSVFYANQAESHFWSAEDYHQKYMLRKNVSFTKLCEKEFGLNWDQHLYFTKLNGDGKKGFNTPYWLSQLPKELQVAYRVG